MQAGKIPGGSDWGTEPENERGLLHAEIEGAVRKEYMAYARGNYMEYFDGIYQSIRNNKDLPVTAMEGLHVIKIIEAAFGSSKEKRVVNI